jgi:hypothetical protein
MKSAKLNILILLLFINGCDIFSTREPEDPDVGRTGNLPATTPNQLFENLKLAFEDKTVDNYMRLFADQFSMEYTFTFIPSAGAIAKYPSLSQWDLNSERIYFENIKVATLDGAPILLTQILINNITQVDSAVFQYDYILTIPFTEESINATYKGRSEYVINLNSSNEWVITSWQDIEVEGFPSWSELKGSFN